MQAEDLLWIIDPNNYTGNAITSMDSTGKVHYSELSFDEYNKSRGGNLLALSWDDYYQDWYRPFELGLQGDWQETTEERYDDMLGAVPPIKHQMIGNFSTFFVGEATSGSLHQMFACMGSRYYTALRDVNQSKESLEEELSLLMTCIIARVESFDGRNLRLEGLDITLFPNHDDDYHEIKAGETWEICYPTSNVEHPTFYAARLVK
jgi:hypothetical protein